eukprot:TRINITY_DN23978_c0_g2_i13.p6 TRINITY_DN23978_c0_g2~~TRINITY_DN23978_c0_g2_i13.p6  ORF type:complete len:167 (-),score=1.65 TRINITY_DN23978_c0_g2_i13:791-1291(-)
MAQQIYVTKKKFTYFADKVPPPHEGLLGFKDLFPLKRPQASDSLGLLNVFCLEKAIQQARVSAQIFCQSPMLLKLQFWFQNFEIVIFISCFYCLLLQQYMDLWLIFLSFRTDLEYKRQKMEKLYRARIFHFLLVHVLKTSARSKLELEKIIYPQQNQRKCVCKINI